MDFEEIKWMTTCFKAGMKFEDFEDSGDERFSGLDMKLGTALTAILQAAGDKARAIIDLLQVKEECIWLEGKLVKGRQILWLINEHFRTSTTTDSYYDVLDLAELSYPGDAKMTTFFYLWDICISSMDPKLPDDTLRDILVKKLKSSQAIKEDLAHYNRLDHGHPEKTYQWIRGRMDAYLLRKQIEKNQEEKSNMFKRGGGNPNPANPAAPAKGDEKGKGKGKEG